MTSNADELSQLLRAHFDDPSSSFSIGAFGAIAEFFFNTKIVSRSRRDGLMKLVTPYGALCVSSARDVLPVAYEGLSRDPDCWTHGIALCLPRLQGTCSCRTVITELGPDERAVCDANKSDRLFDLGLGTINIDFYVRTSDDKLIAQLREACGASLFDTDTRILDCLIDASPHRIVASQIGRIEVYQRLSRHETPSGPHTHLLPKLLRARGTHDANIPIPKDYLPCLTIYPPSPFFDHLGKRRPYEHDYQIAFEPLLEKWGLKDYLARKREVSHALTKNEILDNSLAQGSRVERLAARVALRQAACNPTVKRSQILNATSSNFELTSNRQK